MASFLQLLQTVAVDVSTRGSLGMCLAVRVGDVLSIMKSTGVETTLTRSVVEMSLLEGMSSRRSQQKFLHTKSTDTTVTHACKGVGGNTQNQRCIIVKQECVEEDVLLSIREGTRYTGDFD